MCYLWPVSLRTQDHAGAKVTHTMRVLCFALQFFHLLPIYHWLLIKSVGTGGMANANKMGVMVCSRLFTFFI